jgi:hypothetical protein
MDRLWHEAALISNFVLQRILMCCNLSTRSLSNFGGRSIRIEIQPVRIQNNGVKAKFTHFAFEKLKDFITNFRRLPMLNPRH